MITINSTRVPAAAESRLACANVGFVARNNPTDLQNKALAAGFSHIGGNQYTHADGSWVALDANGAVQRGVGTVMFNGIPGGRAAAAAAPAQRSGQYQGGGVAFDSSKPPLPGSMRGYGIANIGIVNMRNVHTQCTAHGFANNGSSYVHQDGSWVSYANGSIAVGWKGYSLGEMQSLYRNGRGWI
jgi:hypothetical protein